MKRPAETYQEYFVPAMFRPWAAALLRHARPGAGESVLDVACGTGVVAREVAPLVGTTGRVVGLDMNAPMLDLARALAPPEGAAILWQEGDAEHLPFADGSFDLVLCQHALSFFPDRSAASREMRRVLTPGGRACVMVLQALARHPVFEALMESVARHLSLPLADVSTPFALHDADALPELFLRAGFTDVEVITESIIARFPNAGQFVPLAAASSAAAVPAFLQLTMEQRAALLDLVREEADPAIRRYREGDEVRFPMYANVAVAKR